jgi:hypothetical protein
MRRARPTVLLIGCCAIAGVAALPVNGSAIVAIDVHGTIREAGIILRQRYEATEHTLLFGEHLLTMPQTAAENAASMLIAAIAATRLFELVRQHRCGRSHPPMAGLLSHKTGAAAPRAHAPAPGAHLDDHTLLSLLYISPPAVSARWTA